MCFYLVTFTCRWFTTIKRGLPHIAFRKNYLSQLCALLPLPVGLQPDSSGSGLLRSGDYPEVLLGPTRTKRRAHRRRRPVRVEEPAVVSVPVFTIQDPLAAAGAVVLDCHRRCCLSLWTLEVSTCQRVGFRRCRLVWMDFSPDVSRSPKGGGGGDLLGLICLELGVAPLVDPGTDLEDERPLPLGSPLAAVDEYMPLSPTSGVDVEVARALLEVGVLPAMVTPIVYPAVGFSISPATYPVPRFP